MEISRVNIQKLLESNKTVENILSRLSESPYEKFHMLLDPFKESRIVSFYTDSTLYVSSSEPEALEENIDRIKTLLKDNGIEVQKCSEVIDESVGYTVKINVLKKHVEKFCNG